MMRLKKAFGIVGVLMVLVVCENGFGLTCAMAANVSVSNASGGFVGGYDNIQAGINACPDGGKVSVSAGIYMEAIY
ncbi:hypothetical protein HY792_00680 [Candidatus Desantisbacteria bacterium]|nr:hypothetical protein [Candidatus Desantisbacteria bacterium]